MSAPKCYSPPMSAPNNSQVPNAHPWRSPAVLKAGTQLVPFHAISRIDTSDLENLRLVLHLQDGTEVLATGIDAFENVMILKPSALEGRRFSFMKRAWLVHNLLGHPLMQVLALLRLHKAAMWIHDRTVPAVRPVKRP